VAGGDNVVYLTGGAPRVGKSLLAQRVAASQKIGWVSTDLLAELLRVKGDSGVPQEWDAAPEAIAATADWFFPYLERFVWGVSGMAAGYVVEGVSFLPAHVARLATRYEIRAVFLGCEGMTFELFEQFGSTRGYAALPVAMRRQIADDIPRWSAFVRDEAERAGYPYVDVSGDFFARLEEAEALLSAAPPRRN
jgi:hypothetical protein